MGTHVAREREREGQGGTHMGGAGRDRVGTHMTEHNAENVSTDLLRITQKSEHNSCTCRRISTALNSNTHPIQTYSLQININKDELSTTRGGHSHRRCSHSCNWGQKILTIVFVA